MKTLRILLVILLVSLSVCVFVNMQTVKAATPTVPAPTLSPASPIVLGSFVSASVIVSGSSGTPTGSVTFQYSVNSGSTWTNLGTAVALVGGSATSTSFTPTSAGSNYQFRANYGGNVNYTSLTGGSTILTVNKATAAVGTASFAPASPTTLGGSVTVSVSVSGPSGVASPTGNVQFQVKIGAGSFTNFGSAVALSGGSASISYTPQTAATYNFQAVYQGDGNYNSGTTGLPSGTLTVNKATPTIAAPTLNPSGTVTAGTSVSISVNVSGGGIVPTGTATFQVNIGGGGWSNIGSAISLSSGSASTIYVPQSAGSYQFQVIYGGDSNYNGATSSAVSLTVNTGLAVGVSPVGPLTLNVGQIQLFTAAASGGTGTKSYQWYFDGAVVSGQTASTYSYLSVLGSHTIYVRVTDNVPMTVQSNTVSVTGNSALTVSVSPAGPLILNVGQSQTFTATASGGTGTKSYQWYLDSVVVSGQTSQSYSYMGALGSHSIYARVTDSASVPVTVQSNTVSVTVYSGLGVSVSPVSWAMDVGQSKLFTATASGGSGIYSSYQWYVGGVAQSGATAATFTYAAGSIGSYLITVTVTDSLGTTSSQSSASSVAVSASPTVGVSPVGPLTLNVGQIQLFTAAASGGTGTKSYQWYLDGGAVGTNSATYNYLAVLGAHTIYVRVTDSASTPVTSPASNTVSIAVNSVLVTPTASASLGAINQGQTSILSVTGLSGGTTPYIYQWLQKAPGAGSYSSISGATSSSYSFAASSSTTAGTWSFELQVTDSASLAVTVISSVASVTVYSGLGVSVSPVSWAMDVGQSKLFTATPIGGSGVYSSYQWYVGSIAQSGKTSSTFNYSSFLPGSYLITVSVTDSLGATSVQSSPANAAVSASPTVGVSPVGPLTLNVGQIQLFTAAASGGTGTKSYQWYLDGAVVSGQTASTYSYAAVLGLHTVFVKVTDSAPTPVTVQSNTVSVTVNSVLTAPSVSSSVGVIVQGQTSVFSNSSSVATGTSPYSYQWFSKPPGGSYSSILGATSSSYSFVTSIATATGTWSLMLQVKDAAGAVANSSAVSVTVNIPPLDHFVFSSIGTQTAGAPFVLIITAKDASNNTLVNYVGSNILNVSTGSVSPVSTGVFSSGVWTGSVRVTGAGSGITLFTTGSGMSGTSGAFSVNADALNRFTFSVIGSQIAGSAFNITVTAKDEFGNNVTGYTGTPSLMFSAGSINPDKMNPFLNGVGSTSVIVGDSGLDVNITVTDGVYSGVSNNFAVSVAPTASPAPTTAPTYSSTSTRAPAPTSKPTSVPTATPPAPTPTLTAIKVRATMDDGAKVDLAVSGNMTVSQILNVRIATNQSSALSSVSFTVVGENGTAGFCNMTIPKYAVSNGENPVVFIDGVKALSQGFNQDADNFYVWFITAFSMHHVTTQFTLPSISSSISIGPLLAVGITVPEIVTIYVIIAIRRLRRTPDKI